MAANSGPYRLDEADLATLREVIDNQADYAREWIADWIDTDTPADPSSLRELEAWQARLAHPPVSFTGTDRDNLRSWVDAHVRDFAEEWVGDYPEDQSYKDILTACKRLQAALRDGVPERHGRTA